MASLSMNLLVWINIYLIYYNMMNAIFGRVILEIISLWFYKFKNLYYYSLIHVVDYLVLTVD